MRGYTFKIGRYLDELGAEEKKERLNAVRHIPEIAKNLGKEKTKKQFVPFLKGNKFLKILELLDDEEEILVLLAEQIKYLIIFLGIDSIKLFWPHIESLFCSEDSSVRESVS